MTSRTLLASLVAAITALPSLAANPYLWIEADKPARKNFEFTVAPAGERKQFLTNETWLGFRATPEEAAKKLPKEGGLLEYDLDVQKAGKYEVWNRVGFEFMRSLFEWRVDQGAWQSVKPEQLTTDLMVLGYWCEVAWLKLGEQELTAGKHTLQIRLPLQAPQRVKDKGADGKEVEITKLAAQAINYHSDVLCLYQGQFRPNGKFKPDEDYRTVDDKKAGELVYDLKGDGASGKRVELPLSGLWQVCRYDEQEIVGRDQPATTLPDFSKVYWMSIQVPGGKGQLRPELEFSHRVVYRVRVNVPAAMAGKSFVLRLPAVNMMASVFANGQLCGTTKAPAAVFETDLTKGIKPGQVNEIDIVIKDIWYAFSDEKLQASGKTVRQMFNMPTSFMFKSWNGSLFDFPVCHHSLEPCGIIAPPSLIVAGEVYASDVFCKPSVKNKKLSLEVTLTNPTAQERKAKLTADILPARGADAKVEKTFSAVEVTIPAGQSKTVEIAEAWDNPTLWWPDAPFLYNAVTKVSVDNKLVDVKPTQFGFREWQWTGTGRLFTLNGVKWRMWADCTEAGSTAREVLESTRKFGHRMWRFWGINFRNLTSEQTLEITDEMGIVVRRSGIFDGSGGNYLHAVSHKPLFDNWQVQVLAQVKGERNHPSIQIWSIENEVAFINGRNYGQSAIIEPWIGDVAKAVMATDPTRPVMIDGGNCLKSESLPVNGIHYLEANFREYPEEAYTLDYAYRRSHMDAQPAFGLGQSVWRLVPDRPLFMAESAFIRGFNPPSFAQLGGEAAFAGREGARHGTGVWLTLLAEGYRWADVGAHQFWMERAEDNGAHEIAWHPVAVLCRQWNFTFGSSAGVQRTLKVFNDTRHNDPIGMAWELQIDGKRVAGESKTYNLPAGETQEVTIGFKTPAVTKRTSGQLILTCRRGDKEVFRDVKRVAVLPPQGAQVQITKGALGVIDPSGKVVKHLASRNIAFTELKADAEVPAAVGVLVVGPDALSPRDATDPKWLALAARGARVLVLDQAHPLAHTALPADLRPSQFSGSIAFIENLTHPLFAGLDQQDFFCWGGDTRNYRHVYAKASHGAFSLLQCDEQLGYTALAECPVNDGLLVVCQAMVGSKLDLEPVAGLLFDNMLAYLASYKPIRHATAVALDRSDPRHKLLAESGLKFDQASDALAAIKDGKHMIVVADATVATLKALAGDAEAVKAFTAKGGQLMLWGVTPEGLADFNKLVGVEHVIRPFEMERVTMAVPRDPLSSGITNRDVAMYSGEQMDPWAGDQFPASDTFTHVVDLENIASFCDFPNAKAGDTVAARAAGASWPRNVTNGMTRTDHWRFCYYMDSATKNTLEIKLPKPEEVVSFSLTPNPDYAKITKIELYFDDDKMPVVLDVKPTNDRQDFPLTPRKVRSKIALKIAATDNPAVTTTGIDNLWIMARRSNQWREKVKPLLTIGGLVRYPQGNGCIVLCNLNVPAGEKLADNGPKRRNVITSLLTNMHGAFAGKAIVVAGQGLTYSPVDLGDNCNQFLTKDAGWYNTDRDLAKFAVGKHRLGGVDYYVREFKTSPLPSCVMLGGNNVRGQLAKDVKEVKDIPVKQKADALFFLHTFLYANQWSGEAGKEPVLFKYVVKYADGKTQDIPVKYNQGVGNWVAKDPAGLPNASVAWAAKFDDQTGEQAILYQMQWNNPRPDVEITSIDMAYDAITAGQYGAPALLGLTGAKRAN